MSASVLGKDRLLTLTGWTVQRRITAAAGRQLVPEAKEGVGIHIEQGPDGGVVTLDDTTILDAAMRILNEK